MWYINISQDINIIITFDIFSFTIGKIRFVYLDDVCCLIFANLLAKASQQDEYLATISAIVNQQQEHLMAIRAEADQQHAYLSDKDRLTQ